MNLSVRRWALAIGATGFVCGYAGPLWLAPDSNQGPLLGIFLTGPAGLVLGALLGLVMKLLKVSYQVSLAWLLGTCAVVALGSLYLSAA